MINFVLDVLPTYMMSRIHIPQAVTQRLDVIRKCFLWQGNKERERFPFSLMEKYYQKEKARGSRYQTPQASE